MKRLAFGIAATAIVLTTTVFGVSTAQAAAEWPTVQNGDAGVNVQAVQHLVTAQGFATTADGAFGSDTEAQVSAFQADKGLESTGVVDQQTWESLVIETQNGDEGDATTAAQALLTKHGHGLALDGAFGPLTEEATQAFQTAYELDETGIVDAATWRELVGNEGAEYVLPLPADVLPRSEYDDPHHDYPAIDLPVGTGTDVFATAGGTTELVNDDLCGIGVVVNGSDGGRYVYCHFESQTVVGGVEVDAGQKIGDSGNTGNSTGPHLHFGVQGSDLERRCPQNMLLAIYDGTTVPTPDELPTSGCSY